jgi:tetratricopeptide (TPR) repeat protein
LANLKTVFLSSTAKDLQEYRDAAYAAISGMDGYHCVRMEDFGARDAMADDFCRQKVAECDVFVGIVGHCFGSCPRGSKKSYTEQEYDAAIKTGKPRLMFLAPEDFPLPNNLIEAEKKRQKQRALRDRVNAERIRDTFTSPDDLGRRVMCALHNLERTESAEERRPGARVAALMPLPPQPYFAHPYPLQANFTGRVREREMLSQWLAKDNRPVFALIAIGGMGKSALTWAWVNRDVLGLPLIGQPDDPPGAARCRVPDSARPDGILWWSFYESKASFDSFVNTAICYASRGELDPASIPSLYDGCRVLLTLLAQRRILLVLDGLERILNAYTRLDAPYRGDDVAEDPQQRFRACTDTRAGAFLQALCSAPRTSRVLITSRLFPRELDYLMGCCRQDLQQFDLDDAIAFFRSQGVQGTHAELEAQLARYGLHPLALRLLSGMIANDPARPGDIAIAAECNVVDGLVGREHHVLQIAYEALTKEKQQLLSRLAAFRFPVEFRAVKAISNLSDEKETKRALNELGARGLLQRSQEATPRFDLHPIVRQYAYNRLADKQGVHTRLRDYFAAEPMPGTVMSFDELQPVIELYHHTVATGRVDQETSRLPLWEFLFFRSGGYLTAIELLSALFPDGKPFTETGTVRVPRLSDERYQAWTHFGLACSYGFSGQPESAILQFQAANSIAGKRGMNLLKGWWLGSLAWLAELPLGQFAKAEHNLRQSIDVLRDWHCHEGEALSRLQLACLLCERGDFSLAIEQLRAAGDVSDESLTTFAPFFCAPPTFRARAALLMGHVGEARDLAARGRRLAQEIGTEDFVQADWLLGWANLAIAEGDREQQIPFLEEAERYLTEALKLCRKIDLVLLEPDILLAWARWHRAKGNGEEARKYAEEALAIANRCEYRLCQADIHNFLAQLALDAGDRATALQHATIGRERAECDGKPHWYKPAVDEAERLLRECAGKS